MSVFSFFSKKPAIEKITRTPRPVVLIILDGFGISPIHEGNAVWQAKTPNLDLLEKHFPKTLLHSSGNEVGLPYGEFGNSEVGHLNIGAGRIIYQPLLRVSRAIEAGQLDKNKIMKDIKKHLEKTKGSLHFIGLLSAGGVHSHIEHLLSLLDWCKKNKISNIYFHIFTDGRDSPPATAEVFIRDLDKKIKQLHLNAKIASVGGRYFGMDRDKHWDRTKKAYEAIIGTSDSKALNVMEAINIAYAQNKTDEFVQPTMIVDKNNMPIGKISDGDVILFFNIRPDRIRQIAKTFVDRRFKKFKTKKFKKLFVASLTEYDPHLKIKVIFPEEEIKKPLAEVISEKKLKQFHIAETEKYAHVTYFFNGGHEKPYPGETRIIIPSPKVKTYDKKPEMSAESVTNVVLEELEKGKQDFYVINFANPDMVGHTGNIKATIKAIEFVDKCIGKITKKTIELGGAVLITSDHGNAEEMINFETGTIDTEHNIYPVPLILVIKELAKEKENPTFRETISEPTGTLADIAPTILELMKIKQPKEMTGISLLESLR